MGVDETTEERIARNDDTFRGANEGIERAAEQFGADMRIPFICECADPGCQTIVRLTLEEYREVRQDARRFVNASEHRNAEGSAEVVERRDGYVIVEKTGRAGELAEELETSGER